MAADLLGAGSFGLVVGVAALLTLEETRSEASAARARSENALKAYRALLGQRRFVGYWLGAAMNGACLFVYISSSPALLMGHYGIAPSMFGWFFGANALGLVACGQLNRMLLQRYTPDQILEVLGVLAVLCAVAMAAVSFTGVGGMWAVLAGQFLVLASYGVMTANTMAGALSVDPLRAGSGSALMGAGSFGAGALASAVVAALGDGGPRAMSAVFVVCLTISLISIRYLALRRQ